MQKLDGTTIKLNRGDVLNLTLSAKLEDNTDYTFQVGDKVVFSVYEKNKMSDKAVLIKEINITESSQSVVIRLDSNETKIDNLINKPVEYWYEIELNDEYTIIGYDDAGAKVLMLYPEGSKLND